MHTCAQICWWLNWFCVLFPTAQDTSVWRDSCKLLVLEQLLPLWHAQGHRALVFSQTRAMLDIVQGMVTELGVLLLLLLLLLCLRCLVCAHALRCCCYLL